MKKIISLVLAFMMIIGVLPVDQMMIYGADGTPKVTGIYINKIFQGTEAERYTIRFAGENLTSIPNFVSILGSDGVDSGAKPMNPNQYSLEYALDLNQVGVQVRIGSDTFTIDTAMPSINSVDPFVVESGGLVTLKGEGFDTIDTDASTDKPKAKFVSGATSINIEKPAIGSEITTNFTQAGIWSVYFDQTKKVKADTSGTILPVITSHRYQSLFTVFRQLDVSENVEIIPTQGIGGSLATLRGEKLREDMSVFFLSELNGQYNAANMGKFEGYQSGIQSGQTDQLDQYIFTVPKISIGSYYVVLTNKVDPKKDIKSQITSYKVLNQKFTVIGLENAAQINSITPNRGSSKGVDAVVRGRNIGKPSTYRGGTLAPGELPGENGGQELTLKYTGGIYTQIGSQDGVAVDTLTRKIRIIIGNPVTFRPKSQFAGTDPTSTETYDYINITVGEYNQGSYIQDVVVEIETEIKYGTETVTIRERGVLKNGFTYEPLSYVPEITELIPDKIPVNGDYRVLPGLKLTLVGKNFLLYRYHDENGEVHYRYPKIRLTGVETVEGVTTEILDPNKEDSGITVEIFNSSGEKVDGTEGNDLGTKMVVTFEKGATEGVVIKKDALDSRNNLTIINPLRVPADTTEDGDESDPYQFQFIQPAEDKIPKIRTVTPSTVTVSGEKGVKIEGQGFSEKFNLYINGVKNNTAKRNGTGTEIIFDAPATNQEGYVQIIVQNDDGALAIYDDFLYVKTYTDPKITDFNPKKGTYNTLVTLKGQNLLPPNPLVADIESGIGLLQLIGTRVFIGGKDINTYTDQGLQPYKAPSTQPLIDTEEGNIVRLSEDAHSIILQAGEKATNNVAYYKVYFDTYTGKTMLTDGNREVYEIIAEGTQLYGLKGGDKFAIIVGQESIKIEEKTLKFMTPYAKEDFKNQAGEKDGDQITGNRVKVVNHHELTFTVPSLAREGYYDVAIVNPDTKKDERRGNQGFYYSFQPQNLPEISRIEPTEGSVDGGYDVYIYGKNFVSGGTVEQKSTVTIGGVTVPPEDVEVSYDKTYIRFKVPKYPGDLATETEMDRKYVPIVVTNPDGGSAHIDGFAYIIPISNPEIFKLVLEGGSAAGGRTVRVEGQDFRYFEPFRDTNNNGIWDVGEPFTDKNGNGIWDNLLDEGHFERLQKTAGGWDKNILPILPKVYFGNQLATVTDFGPGLLVVETPKGIKGPAQVYVVNNDYGVSNKVPYTYETLSPKINSILPNSGRKQGNDKIEILGEAFATSKVQIYGKDTTVAGSVYLAEKELVQVQFGRLTDTNISNSAVKIDEPNDGWISNKRATVEVGSLTVSYDASQPTRKLSARIIENKIEYKIDNLSYHDQEVFLPLNLLTDKDGKAYPGSEIARIRLILVPGANQTYRLGVDRGFSPSAQLINQAAGNHINVITPTYYTIGSTPVTVINPDGSQATSNFTYKNPDSDPFITKILKDGEPGYETIIPDINDGKQIQLIDVNYTGGNIIEVIGGDFRKPVKIRIGESVTITQGIEYDPADTAAAHKLTFTMPAVSENLVGRPLRLVVENEDGGFVGSDSVMPDPIYIRFTKPESVDMAITGITPNFGPTAGGTTVTIQGKDFRSTMDGYPDGELKVYFVRGQQQVPVPKENIISVSIDRIVLKTPAYTPGLVDVKVQNPDGNIVELKNGFTYVSDPKIISVVSPENDKMVIETLSVEGGEKIKLIGTDFLVGARVVFNPVLRKLDPKDTTTGQVFMISGERYVLESGAEGTEVTVENPQSILVTTPPGNLEAKGIIVINPDNAASPIYNINYGIPEIGSPMNVVATLAFDEVIRVNWTGVTGAKEYEIYVREGRGQFEFIGTTELLSYAYTKLEPRTRYQFLVRAVGQYGSSKPIEESQSNEVLTGATTGPKDTDGGLVENTKIEKKGDTAHVIIGHRNYLKQDLMIDLTRGTLAGSKEVIISMPASIVTDMTSKSIKVIGKDFSLVINPTAFLNDQMNANRNNANAGVRFKISPYVGQVNLKNGITGDTVLATMYQLEGTAYVGQQNQSMDYLRSSIGFNLDHDLAKAHQRRLTNPTLVRYDAYNSTWQPTPIVNRLGLYTILGSRR